MYELCWLREFIFTTGTNSMKDFSNASFPPETISIMKDAMDAAVATLPDPVSLAHVDSIAAACGFTIMPERLVNTIVAT